MAANDLVTGTNLGLEFDVGAIEPNKVRLKIGDGLERLLDGTIQVNLPTEDVDQTLDATFNLAAVDIHNNGAVVQMVDNTLDAGWVRTANQVSYLGTAPENVKGFISISAPDSGASQYWSRPKLRVLRNGVQIAIIDDLVMQQTGLYDGDAVINGVSNHCKVSSQGATARADRICVVVSTNLACASVAMVIGRWSSRLRRGG